MYQDEYGNEVMLNQMDPNQQYGEVSDATNALVSSQSFFKSDRIAPPSSN